MYINAEGTYEECDRKVYDSRRAAGTLPLAFHPANLLPLP